MNDAPRILGDRYQLGPVLGRGGMAQVRQARDTRLGREVAIKELRIDLASDSTFQARFRREAQAAAGLNHPNIVAVYDTGEQLDEATGIHVPFIVMELVEGRTLRDILREGRPILPRRVLEFTQGVLEALAYSHKAGIVHRDIKPANVMVTHSGMVKVMDFGIARAVSDTSSTMTQTAAVIGTAQYLSPEQARGETVDARSDLYSAGCLMYELLVGRPPFQGDSPVSVAYQHVREQPVPPRLLDSEVTPDMNAVVLKALAKDPADRYQSAGAMREDITRVLAGQPVQAAVVPPKAPTAPATGAASASSAATAVLPTVSPNPPPGGATVAAAPTPARRATRRMWPILAAVLVLALIAGGVLLLFPPNRARQVTVPIVTGQQEAIAKRILTTAGLVPVVKPVQGPDDGSVGEVTAQTPEANTVVAENSEVQITVNQGTNKLIVPMGLVGQDVDRAIEFLAANGLPGASKQAAASEPPEARANEVLSVEPKEGAAVSAGTKIVLTYATGKATVPDVVGFRSDAAKNELTRAGFTKTEVVGSPTGTVVERTVPAAGTVLDKGALVRIVMEVKPPPPPTITTTAPPPRTTVTAPTTTPPTTTPAATRSPPPNEPGSAAKPPPPAPPDQPA